MKALIDAIRGARQTGSLDEIVALIPYVRFLGVSMTMVNEELVGKLSYSQKLIGNSLIPALHGGTVGSLLESTAIFTLIMKAEAVLLPKTINITVEYLRSGKAEDTFACAEFTKLGRRVANVRAYAWQQDRSKPIAAANAHFLLKTVDGTDQPQRG